MYNIDKILDGIEKTKEINWNENKDKYMRTSRRRSRMRNKGTVSEPPKIHCPDCGKVATKTSSSRYHCTCEVYSFRVDRMGRIVDIKRCAESIDDE